MPNAERDEVDWLPRTRGRSSLDLVRLIFFVHLICMLACGALAIHASKSTVQARQIVETLPAAVRYGLIGSMVVCPVAMLILLLRLPQRSHSQRFKIMAAEAVMAGMQLFFFYNVFRIG